MIARVSRPPAGLPKPPANGDRGPVQDRIDGNTSKEIIGKTADMRGKESAQPFSPSPYAPGFRNHVNACLQAWLAGEGSSNDSDSTFFRNLGDAWLQAHIAKGPNLSPTVWPTAKEFNDAKGKFKYAPGDIHFAITGLTGTGKSSLVNSLRGLLASDPGAAKTGVTECTMEAGRYYYPNQGSPLLRIVWHDIPGAGTQNTPGGSGYFNAQGLFLSDCIIVAIGDRLTEQDLDILVYCGMYNIPSFIVRSKSDIHIRNIENDEDCSYDDAYNKYINDTRRNFSGELRKASGKKSISLDYDQEIFLVSKRPLCDFIRSLMYGTASGSTRALIDEHSLITSILLAALVRRYPSGGEAGWHTS